MLSKGLDNFKTPLLMTCSKDASKMYFLEGHLRQHAWLEQPFSSDTSRWMCAMYKPKRSQPYLYGARHIFIKVRICEKEKILVSCNAICGVARRRDGWATAILHDS